MYRSLRGLGVKTAVVTGAASGLGRALSLDLARSGWTIGIADIDLEGARETVELVKGCGGSGEAYRCDVRSVEEVSAMAGHFFDEWGKVALLVNNAGVAVAGLVGDVEVGEWRRIVDINMWGTVFGCHAFIPRMKAQGGGHILNIASAAGIVSLPEMAPYNMVKAAVISLSETLHSELAPCHIGVTVGCPTFFKTNLLDTMSCTDDFQSQFAHAAFDNATMTTEEVASRLLKAVWKNRLYAFPQRKGWLTWVLKRISPSAHHGVLKLMNGSGTGRSVLKMLADKGYM